MTTKYNVVPEWNDGTKKDTREKLRNLNKVGALFANDVSISFQ